MKTTHRTNIPHCTTTSTTYSRRQFSKRIVDYGAQRIHRKNIGRKLLRSTYEIRPAVTRTNAKRNPSTTTTLPKVKSTNVTKSTSKPLGPVTTKKLGKGRNVANKKPTIMADAGRDTYKQSRWTKRSRVEDLVVLSEDAKVI